MDVVRKIIRDFYFIVKSYTGADRMTVLAESEAEDIEYFTNLFMTYTDPTTTLLPFKGF